VSCLRRALGLSSALALLSGAGCSAVISPDESRLGGGPSGSDGGGGLDAPIVLVDGSVVPDGPVGPDRPPVGCEGQPPTCEGDTLVQCVAGSLVRTNCAATGGDCVMSGGAASCTATGCAPAGSSRCDGDDLVTCHGDGTETRMTCPSGCDPAANACATAPVCPGIPALARGMTTIDLCAERDASTHASAEGCRTDERADSGDRVYRLDIETATTVVLDLVDADGSTSIDTILYVRTDCEDASSQLACSDDIPCSDSVITSGCVGGWQVRQSRLVLRLEPGTYYVVVDAFLYSTGPVEFRCGTVILSYTTLAGSG
jgi:hypothetical protein